MKKILHIIIVFSFLPSLGLWAGGTKEEEPSKPAEEIVTEEVKIERNIGNYHVYSTLQEYEEETGKKITGFKESPMLAEKVRAGDLPPVEERLPEEPCVIQPTDKIGKYGGTVTSITSTGESVVGAPGHLTMILPTGEYVNWAAKEWKVADDFKSVTISLRKGLRWSDGAPFTADDIVFWFEDIKLNKDLTAVLEPRYMIRGEPLQIEKIDDYTVRFVSSEPSYSIQGVTSKDANTWPSYRPKHYLEKWHIKYNKDADKLAKEEGFDTWWMAFDAHNKALRMGGQTQQADPNMPTLGPFMLVEKTADKLILERNPYFWAVDTEGNQLPYIDHQVEFMVGNQETFLLRIMNGDVDYRVVEVWDIPPLIENAERGGYRLLMDYIGSELAWPSITFNLSLQDPVLGPIIRDVRFRRALSLGINREEILEGPWHGMARVCQVTVRDNDPLFKEEWITNHVEYDPDRANLLLDEMGLKWDKDHEYRLRPDGEPLTLILDTMQWNLAPTEPIIAHWKKLGVELIIKLDDWSYYLERAQSNETHLSAWTVWIENEEIQIFYSGYDPSFIGNPWGYPWEIWRLTEGKEGIEPPEWVKTYFKYRENTLNARNEEEYLEWGTKTYQWLADYLPVLGTVGYNTYPVVASNRLKNVWPWNKGPFETENMLPQWYLEE